MNDKENSAVIYSLLQMTRVRGPNLTDRRILEQLTRYVPLEEARTILNDLNVPDLSSLEVGRLGVAFYNGRLKSFYSFRRHEFMPGITFHQAHSRASWRIRMGEVASRLDRARERLDLMSPDEITAETSEFDRRYSTQEPVFDVI
ncbi:hypothetical protein HN592_04640 [Candidatus Woesearchaeota archaeon]|mgnify:FL=1|jgi:hypothetical protein|nr:hypothetical protein [Candidatus Woesearchaeota archaeon]MBT4368500.1 hypothetical protein [Candidatus Woesearchaeota archaeon]MBT4712989.1 hypothetical protein [Candidatus Woesearchaeota archaeon]MBT6639901.1 hypothetical protein [Candidatus Woesearchaeota archaeon]MBT7134073.1 hypothetical protein [Candidatus Woesearchaeota archaeon]